MRSLHRKIGIALLATAALTSTSFASAAAQEGTTTADFETPTQIPATPEGEVLEKLEKPLVPEDVSAWADAVQQQFDEHPQFSAVEIDDTRTNVIVWWHDAPSPELEAAASIPLSASVEVKQTLHSPAELEAAVERVFKDDSLRVSYASIRPDGSGIDVSTSGSARYAAPTGAVEAVAGVPVSVTPGSVDAYTNRQFDEYLIGGANYARWENNGYRGNCSTGFSLIRKNDPNVRGFVTAAHCGSVGSQWGPMRNNTIHTVGSMQERNTAIDTAVVQSAGAVFQAYIYTGPYNSGTVTAINGNRSAPIGAEICYSGSYTGLVCGNFVTSRTATWNLGGDLTNVSGIRTDRNNNSTIAAGQGDSGGPGYLLTVENGVVKRYATAIISAGPNAQQGGCPGLRADRLCGPSVLAGETWRFANTSNWQLAVIP